MSLTNFLFYVAAFFGLWYGSGLIVASIKSLSRKLRVPSFAFSFFVLGVLTSIPEMAVGFNSLREGHPEIFVGGLLGGIIVMFLLVIPLLAVINRKIHVKRHMTNKNLLATLGIVAAPALFTLDKTVTNTEGVILIALYSTLFYIIRTRQNVFARVQKVMKKEQGDLRHSSFLRLAGGIALVFLTSQYIVQQTIAISDAYNISALIVSLLVLGLGANLPELTLAIRSLSSKAEDVALGDYLGSAAVNTLLFGVFTLMNQGEVVTEKSFAITLGMILFALGAFFLMTRGKRSELSWKEGLLLIAAYAAFIAYEATNL